jgi:hypothetical protein
VIADILGYIKKYSEDFVNKQYHGKSPGDQISSKKKHITIDDCLLTVPVNFTIIHKRLMLKAAELAGFKVINPYINLKLLVKL